MPELDHPWAYWILLAATIIAMIGMWLWIKKKKWF
jgi:Mg2+ and Co2+ transporter CorA